MNATGAGGGTGPSVGPRNVWVDGRVVPADAPHLTVFDRGFQLGDGIFETLRARGGRCTELDEHLARLHRSADGLGIPLAPATDDGIRRGIGALLAAEGLDGPDGDASIRITVSRGASPERGTLPNRALEPTVVIQAWPVAPTSPELLERGLALVAADVRRDPENPLVTLKTTSRADYVHAKLQATRAGADDALFLTIDGHLSEATSANLFVIRDGELATPSLACAILPGTTRTWILGWGERVGLRVREDWLTTRDLAEADEAFLCSSVAGILPVTAFEGRAVGDGTPGPWTRRARADREAFIRGEDAAG